jgi:6-phosphogluconate dehydrogenase
MVHNIGLVGLGPMGRSFAQNLMSHGFQIKAWEQDPEVRQHVAHQIEPDALASSLEKMISFLPSPRDIFLFLPSGKPIDDTLDLLCKQLEPGDTIADCGNSHYLETERRQQRLEGSGIDLIGIGVSGGPKGAISGPAIMVGGNRASWQKLQPVLESVSAVSGGTLCCNYFGQGGAGHFVKMVHNGIEYGIMHLLAELHTYLEIDCGMEPDAIASTFGLLNDNLTAGYLTEITATVVNARTHPGGQPLIQTVDDAAEQKGTGRWTIQAALDFGVAIPTISEAVMARSLSSNRTLRQEGSGEYPEAVSPPYELKVAEIARIGPALALASLSTFAQGLTLFSAVGSTFGKQLDRATILRTWRQGCILRGGMVTALLETIDSNPKCQNLILDGRFRETVQTGLPALRSLTADAISVGIPMAGFASALAYVELLNRGPWPGCLIQLQRDYFGSHGLRHKDTGAIFHGPWHEGD